MRLVFDLDDTIQFANYRDYNHATPNPSVIENIRKAKENGAEIIISTARGMLSCCGDADKADQKNRSTIEQWLKKYNVPCDELRFGKPMADFYIDDKAVSVKEFIDGGIERFNGYSGCPVWRVGSKIQKYAAESDKVAFWYKQAQSVSNGLYSVPEVYSFREGNIQIEYVDGSVIFKDINKEIIDRLCDILRQFESCRCLDNNLDDYISYIEKRCDGMILKRFKEIAETKRNSVEPLFKKGTFCHGDFSTSNILHSNNGLYLIDPRINRWNTWLLDAAKLRASLSGLGKIFGDTETHTDLLRYFDSQFSETEILAIDFLEMTQYIRVLPYAKSIEDAELLKNIITERWC